MATLHVHADEAGDLNFRGGSKYFILAVAWTFNPRPLADRLRELRFSLVKTGFCIERFHAAADNRRHRSIVMTMLREHEEWSYSAMVIRKAMIFKELQEPGRFYPNFMVRALNFVLRSNTCRRDASRVLIYTDRLPQMQATKAAIEKAIKTACGRELKPRSIPFQVAHHYSGSNKWLQVVDYCCWGVQRKYEQGDSAAYDELRPRLAAPELYLWP